MSSLRPLAPRLRVALLAGLTASCLPSQFEDLSSHRDEADPSTACDAGGEACPEPDAGPTPGDASMPKDASAPPVDAGTDAGAPVDAGPKDAGPRDSGPPPPVDAGPPVPPMKDWPPATVMKEETPFKGCVYVEICTHAATGGAVCRLHTGCQLNASTHQECLDNLDVCGVPTNPIFCNRASTSCITP